MSLNLFIGCMFAAKTTELIRIYQRCQYANKKCLMVKPRRDQRYSVHEVVTHDHRSITSLICDLSQEVIPLVQSEQYEYVLFDEGQFIPDLVETCDQLTQMGVQVYVSALQSDFRQNPFPVVSRLIAKCDGELHRLKAVCLRCGRDASFTQLIVPVNLTKDQNEYIGGSESYQPVCRQCFGG